MVSTLLTPRVKLYFQGFPHAVNRLEEASLKAGIGFPGIRVAHDNHDIRRPRNDFKVFSEYFTHDPPGPVSQYRLTHPPARDHAQPGALVRTGIGAERCLKYEGPAMGTESVCTKMLKIRLFPNPVI